MEISGCFIEETGFLPGFFFSRWNDAAEKDQKIIGKSSHAVRFCAGFLGGFLSASKTYPMHRNYEPHRPHNTETFYQHDQPTNPSSNKNTWDTQSGRPTCRSGSWQSNLLPAKENLKFPIIAVKRSVQVTHPEYQRKTVQQLTIRKFQFYVQVTILQYCDSFRLMYNPNCITRV